MALLNFPPSPLNNQLYPTNPLPGQNQYRYDSTTQTWMIEGSATAVAPGCYGDAYNVPTFCVDAQGRLTFAQNVAILTSGGTVTDITAGFGLLGGTITTSGTISLDTSFTDSLYLQLAGGTMAGDITFSGTQTFPGTLPLTGGTMTGDITFSGTQTFPVPNLQAVTTSGATSSNVISLANLVPGGSTAPILNIGNSNSILWSGGSSQTIKISNQSIRFGMAGFGIDIYGQNVGATSSYSLYLPNAQGAAGTTLVNDGTGQLSWGTGGGSVGTLQTVTDNGATTTNNITVQSSTNPTGENVVIYPNNINILNGRIQVQTGGLPGINIDAVGTPSLTVFGGGSISMGTGTSSYSEKIKLDGNTGKVGINGPTGTATVTVNGTYYGNTVTTTGNYQIDRGGIAVGLLSGDSTTTSYLPSALSIAASASGGLSLGQTSPQKASIFATGGSNNPSLVFKAGGAFVGGIPGDIIFKNAYETQQNLTITEAGNVSILQGTLTAKAISIPSNAGLPAPSLGLWSPAPNGLMVTADGTLSLRGFASSTVQQLDITGNGAVFTVDSVRLNPRGGVTTAIRFYDNSTTNFIGLKAPLTIAGNVTFTLPATDGAANEVMTTDGAGNLGWLATAKVVAVPGSSGAGGAAGQIAFGNGFFYWFDPTGNQWLRVAGLTF